MVGKGNTPAEGDEETNRADSSRHPNKKGTGRLYPVQAGARRRATPARAGDGRTAAGTTGEYWFACHGQHGPAVWPVAMGGRRWAVRSAGRIAGVPGAVSAGAAGQPSGTAGGNCGTGQGTRSVVGALSRRTRTAGARAGSGGRPRGGHRQRLAGLRAHRRLLAMAPERIAATGFRRGNSLSRSSPRLIYHRTAGERTHMTRGILTYPLLSVW